MEKPHAIGNFTIVINSDEKFIDGYSFSDHKILFSENQLLKYDLGATIGCIEAAFLFYMKLPD